MNETIRPLQTIKQALRHYADDRKDKAQGYTNERVDQECQDEHLT